MNKVPKLIWFILGLLLILNLVSIAIAVHNPSGRSYPQVQYVVRSGPVGPIGASGVQGQAGISVQGATGAPGEQGLQGPAGPSVTSDQIASSVLDYLQANPPAQGPQGNPGQDGQEIQLRTNPTTSNLEYKYSNDFNWTLLLKVCQLTNTCP